MKTLPGGDARGGDPELSSASPDLAWDLRTPDVRLIRGRVAGLLRPFRLRTQPARNYDARVLGRRFGHTGMVIIDYGQEVDVEAEPMQTFSLIQVPIHGSFELSGRSRTTLVDTRHAHFLGPANRLRMHWSPDCRLLVMRLDETATRRLMDRCRAGPGSLICEDDPGMVLRIDSGPGGSLFRLMCLMRDEALADGCLTQRKAYLDSLERLLMHLLSNALKGDSDPQTEDRPDPTREHLVKHAKAYMRANLGRQITADDIAAACGVSKRSLFQAFRNSGQDSPKAWLTEQRLARVREELCGSRSVEITVTEAAMNCGFTHLGRFAAQYRRRFGENPSATRNRRKDH